MTRILLACYGHFLAIYPRQFRSRYAHEMQLFMRDYAREHGSAAIALFLFSDLLLSIPREHAREMTMQHLITTAVGVLLLSFVGVHLYHDVTHQEVRMGFLLVITLTTVAISGVYLLLRLRQPSRRYLWLIPAAYAAAAASWLIVTPIRVNDFAPLRPFLFSLGRPGAIGFLFVPVFIALLPALRPKHERTPTIATLLMLAFVVLATGLAGTYYAPAAAAMLLVRFAWSQRDMETRSAQ
jgi:hypothetical protein